MKHQVVLTSEFPDIATALLSQECDVITHPASGLRSEEELIAILADADGAITLLTDSLSRRVLESNPHLRVVANYAVGYDNIDLDAARELGITIANTPGVLTDATADLTMALILATTRRIIEGDRMVREGRFDGWHPLMLLGTSLRGKTLGILGMGRIGRAVAQRALAFGMSIAYHSRTRLPDAEAEGFEYRTLDDLVRSSDVLTIHAPLNDETKHLLDGTRLRSMKRGAFLVNTARGPIVDEAALARVLAEGHLAGAGLDVYEREPEVQRELLDLENVTLLPHLGSATAEARDAMARLAANGVLAVLRGGQPANRVV